MSRAASVLAVVCRSREGAWIEIIYKLSIKGTTGGRSREGAWIEILLDVQRNKRKPSLPRGSVD